MVKVRGKPLLAHIVAAFNGAGIKRIQVVRGYRPEAVDVPALHYTDNPDYAGTGELASLALALAADPDDAMDLCVAYGDVLFKRYVLEALRDGDDEFTVIVDTDWRESVNRARAADYVHCTAPHSRRGFNRPVFLERAGESLPESEIHGEWMGFLRVSARALPRLRAVVAEMAADPAHQRAKLHHLLMELARRGERVRVVYTTGNWLDVDSLEDVVAAGSFA
jgi:phosphoenolpyruvate phosphomutase